MDFTGTNFHLLLSVSQREVEIMVDKRHRFVVLIFCVETGLILMIYSNDKVATRRHRQIESCVQTFLAAMAMREDDRSYTFSTIGKSIAKLPIFRRWNLHLHERPKQISWNPFHYQRDLPVDTKHNSEILGIEVWPIP